MIRDAHWYALAAGERSSEGLVTGAARKTRDYDQSDPPDLVANDWKVVTYVRDAVGSESTELVSSVTGTAI
jgi:hypothetical protein